MSAALIVGVAVLAAGFLRGLTGFGFALAAVPVLSLILTPLEAVLIAQLLQLAMSPVDLLRNHAHVDRRALGLLVLGAVPGVPLGVAVATAVSPDLLRLTIALAVIAGLAAILARVRVPEGRGPALAAGGLAGLFSGLAAMPGPPVVAYFLGRGAAPKVARATNLMFFAASSAFALSLAAGLHRAVDLRLLGIAALSLPVLLVGSHLGEAAFRRLADETYRRAAIAVLAVSALVTGAKGLAGLL